MSYPSVVRIQAQDSLDDCDNFVNLKKCFYKFFVKEKLKSMQVN